MALVVLLFAYGIFVLWVHLNRVTSANLRRIRQGMSKAEVESILGPPDEFPVDGTAKLNFDIRPRLEPPCPELNAGVWRSNQSVIIIGFDGSGHVTKTSGAFGSFDERFFDDLRALWQRWLP
jgi:hypothetical protein